MKSIRQLNNKAKLCASSLIAFGIGAGVSGWLLAELDSVAVASARFGPAARAFQSQVTNIEIGAAACLVLGLVTAVLLGLWLAAEVARPLQQAAEFARRIAAGDLGDKLEIEDSGDAAALLRNLQHVHDKLKATMQSLRAGAEALVHGTGDIASGSLDLSSRTEQQASSLQETAATMEELTSTVKQNADHAHQASKLAISASEVAVKGGNVVSEVVGTMASINESSKRIAEIIGVIDGIAFQTNILALNAAVEAARAGEQGRGFAVVASEVRSLAQRSAAAAKEIKELIDDSVEKVNAGTQLADKAGNTMNEVVSSVKRVTDIIGEIADASAEQTSGIDQVNNAIAAMDQATQQNAALVEQSAAAAASMREQADNLTRLVNTFGRKPAEPQKSALPSPAARPAQATRPAPAARQAGQPEASSARTQPPARQPGAASAPDGASGRPRQGRPVAAPRRARGGAQPAPAPETDWEEF